MPTRHDNKKKKDAYPKKVCHMPTKHAQKRRRRRKKDTYPKKVCHMPTRHVKEKKEEEKKDSPHPKEIKERDGS